MIDVQIKKCCSDETSKLKSTCCLSQKNNIELFDQKYNSFIIGKINSPVGYIPVVSSDFTIKDMLGAFMCRWGIKRNSYAISPGLYAIGVPDSTSPVFVTANYKFSFDMLRRELGGINGWILVLDTKGINVWCAAGKGTFGSDELINRINKSELSEIISKKELIVPQLGAVNVSAFRVKKETGFKVFYGPVRANEIKEYLNNGYEATKDMRLVTFTFRERLALTPIELVFNVKYLLLLLLAFFITSLFTNKGFSFPDFSIIKYGILGIGFSYLCGNLIAPLLLPYLPFRSFSLKGSVLGIVCSGVIILFSGMSVLPAISITLIIVSAVSFFTLLFTGATTFTSLSGVKKEMKTAIPVQLVLIILGLILNLITKIIE